MNRIHFTVYVKSLNGRVAAHTVLTELDDQNRFSLDMASYVSETFLFL